MVLHPAGTLTEPTEPNPRTCTSHVQKNGTWLPQYTPPPIPRERALFTFYFVTHAHIRAAGCTAVAAAAGWVRPTRGPCMMQSHWLLQHNKLNLGPQIGRVFNASDGPASVSQGRGCVCHWNCHTLYVGIPFLFSPEGCVGLHRSQLAKTCMWDE